MGVEWIEYQGKPILYVDFRGMNSERLSQCLESIFKAIRESVNDIVILANQENITISSDFLGKAKELTKESRKESETTGRFKVKKIAMVGVKGIASFLLYSYNLATGQNIVDFKTEEEAKEWLVQ
ncbi:MAG TPA: hypothetical protein VHY08_00095 [Bacillota bacterium]|nr:hypothetical protein [Bacillota bacterium]